MENDTNARSVHKTLETLSGIRIQHWNMTTNIGQVLEQLAKSILSATLLQQNAIFTDGDTNVNSEHWALNMMINHSAMRWHIFPKRKLEISASNQITVHQGISATRNNNVARERDSQGMWDGRRQGAEWAYHAVFQIKMNFVRQWISAKLTHFHSCFVCF